MADNNQAANANAEQQGQGAQETPKKTFKERRAEFKAKHPRLIGGLMTLLKGLLVALGGAIAGCAALGIFGRQKTYVDVPFKTPEEDVSYDPVAPVDAAVTMEQADDTFWKAASQAPDVEYREF